MYTFPFIERFKDREAERRVLEVWWGDPEDRQAVGLYGRRRVGKSWLLRAFAHGKPAEIFVADTRAEHDLLAEWAASLEPSLGVRPELPDLAAFFRLLFRRAKSERRLAVIDELPFLLKIDRTLPTVLLRIMEEEADSRLKLIVCGSHVGMMGHLFEDQSPLHDRLRQLSLEPFTLWKSLELISGEAAEARIAAYATVGGMPRYLDRLAAAGRLDRRLISEVLGPLGALFNEPRAVLAQELAAPHNYFSILAALARGPLGWADLVAASHVDGKTLAPYLGTLEELRIVSQRRPVTDALEETRNRRYFLEDGFMRFWFRYVFPFQADLESGLDPRRLWREQVAPTLHDHVAPAFERICRDWVRAAGIGGAQGVGAWWGPSTNVLRASRERTSEEIDIVGLRDRSVRVVGECRWRNDPMDVSILGDIDRFKLPALAQIKGVEIPTDLAIVLFSRAGFTDGLIVAARRDRRVRLVSLDELLTLPADAPGS